MSRPNYFDARTAAQRYAQNRPFYHEIPLGILRRHTGRNRFALALDVACGTGMSTRALAQICDHVIAVDPSAEMLAHAPRLWNVEYKLARAEQLPFSDGTFELITVSSAFHWFDQDRFLHEAQRVLQKGGLLAVYNHGFRGELREDAGFKEWAHRIYPSRYPSPSRSARKLTGDYAAAFGFELVCSEQFESELVVTRSELASYLSTQSNVTAVVEHGGEPLEQALAWIEAGLAPFFTAEPRTALFRGDINVVRKR